MMAEAPPPPASTTEQDFDLEGMFAEAGPTAVSVDPGGISACRVEKPRRGSFFYVHPTWRRYIYIIPGDYEGKREPYWVSASLAETAAFSRFCQKVLVVPYADQNGNFRLWLIPESDPSGRPNKFHTSARVRATQAIGRWCQLEANFANQCYELLEAVNQQEAPTWPVEGLDLLLRKAFEDRIVKSPDHPIWATVKTRKVAPVVAEGMPPNANYK
jgi:hypothetical protein